MNKQDSEKLDRAKQAVVSMVNNFIGAEQAAMLNYLLRGEECLAIADQVLAVWDTIKAMPATYGNEGKKHKDVVVHLHYFRGGVDVWVTEKDIGEGGEWTPVTPQLQAYGIVDLGHGPDIGYISLQEILQAGMELDLHWVKKDMESVYKEARNRGHN